MLLFGNFITLLSSYSLLIYMTMCFICLMFRTDQVIQAGFRPICKTPHRALKYRGLFASQLSHRRPSWSECKICICHLPTECHPSILKNCTATVLARPTAYVAARVWIYVSVLVTSQKQKTPASPLSLQMVTFHRLLCRYLRMAFFPAKPKHRFESDWHAKLLALK